MTEYNTGDLRDAEAAAILTVTAQQAALPTRLNDGELYATIDADGAIKIVTTPGYDRTVDDDRAATPRRLKRQGTVRDVPSMLDYIGEHTTDGGQAESLIDGNPSGRLEVWADIDRSAVTAIIDGGPGWCSHTITLALKHSREWTEWTGIDGKMLDQEAFAEFIEDHISTIAKPDGAKLLEICQTLTGHTNQQWRSQKILANGQRQLQWEESVEAKAGDKGDLTIPAELQLVLRPYQGGEPVLINARFRYRMRGGALSIGIKLTEPDRVLEQAFNLNLDSLQAGLPEGVTIRNGRA